MCCQSDRAVGLIHTKLEKMDGVKDVKVNLVLRRVTVMHTAAVTADKLAAAQRVVLRPRCASP